MREAAMAARDLSPSPLPSLRLAMARRRGAARRGGRRENSYFEGYH